MSPLLDSFDLPSYISELSKRYTMMPLIARLVGGMFGNYFPHGRGGKIYSLVAWERVLRRRSDWRVEGNSSLMWWNFHQITPVNQTDNWCQSFLDFSDLNPNSDDTMETETYLFPLSLGSANCEFTRLQITNLLYVHYHNA